MLECVVNVSEGRRTEVLDAIGAACGGSLLDVHVDPDHHRAVFTLAGPGRLDAAGSARRGAAAAADRVDLSVHQGVHPRLGAVDVVPFVALEGTTVHEAVDAARGFGDWFAGTFAVPVFFYGDACTPGTAPRTLPDVRTQAFRGLAPDVGPSQPHPRLGATAVGVRPVLVAVNCELSADDVGLARRLASAVRERDGGLPGVRALGFRLATRARAQVSMNLVDLDRTGVEVACTRVRELARAEGADVAVEVVGLLPAAELDRCSAGFLSWCGVTRAKTIEARLAGA
ncbi:MAG: glutamate formiminotransferase [Acidimicrobiia bacterium]